MRAIRNILAFQNSADIPRLAHSNTAYHNIHKRLMLVGRRSFYSWLKQFCCGAHNR